MLLPGFATFFALIFAFDGMMNFSRNCLIGSFASSDCAYSLVFASEGKVGFATAVLGCSVAMEPMFDRRAQRSRRAVKFADE